MMNNKFPHKERTCLAILRIKYWHIESRKLLKSNLNYSVKRNPMKKSKGILQKFSVVSGAISFVLSAICGVFLYFKVKEVGYENTVSASLLASVFFFIFVGILLTIIGKSDLPSFKFDDNRED